MRDISGVILTYKAKNKHFQAWLPRDDCEWFEEWLKINSVGSDTATRFRQYVINLKANPTLHSRIQPTPQSKFVCLRGIKMIPQQREWFCSSCKKRHPHQWQACQEVNKETQT